MRARSLHPPRKGTALVLALWIIVLLSTLLAVVATAARSHASADLQHARRVRADLAARAGLAHALVGLQSSDLRQRWVPDGRAYRFALDGADVTVRVTDISGLVDLNASPAGLLRRVFALAGAAPARARRLADQAVTFRNARAAASGPSAADATHAIAQGGFRTLDELALLSDMDPQLLARASGSLTVFSRRRRPDAAYAGFLALAAMRRGSLAGARAIVQARHRRAARVHASGHGDDAGTQATPRPGYGHSIVQVTSSARLPHGAVASVRVTLRKGARSPRSRPFTALHWRSGPAEWR